MTKESKDFLESFIESFKDQDYLSIRKLVLGTLIRKNGKKLRMSLLMAPTHKIFGEDGLLWAIRTYIERGSSLPLAPFQRDFYLIANPDVAAAGVEPLVHFLQLGINEGRTPHPLIDTAELYSESTELSLAQTLTRYCYSATLYKQVRQSHVNIRGYVDSLGYVPSINPIFAMYAGMPHTLGWVNRRLMAINMGSRDPVYGLGFACTNVLLSNLHLGARPPKIGVATRKFNLSGSNAKKFKALAPGVFLVSEDSYCEIGDSPISSVPSNSWSESNNSLVYLSNEIDLRTNKLLILRGLMDRDSLVRHASENESIAVSPPNRNSQRALINFVEENNIKTMAILEIGKVYSLPQDCVIEFLEESSNLGKPSVIEVVDTPDATLNPLRIIDVSNWQVEKYNIPDDWESPNDYMLVDFDFPKPWVKTALTRKQLVVDKGFRQHALLLGFSQDHRRNLT